MSWNPDGEWSGSDLNLASSQDSIDLGDGWAKTFQDVLKLSANAFAQSTLMQKNQQGQAYLEGQRIAALKAQGIGGIPLSTLLLIGGGVLVFMMMKD